MQHLARRFALVAAVAAALVFASAPRVNAAGIASAAFGGTHGHPTTDNPTAIYYNPAGIALSHGWRVFVDANTILRWGEYERPVSAIGSIPPPSNPLYADIIASNAGTGRMFNVLAAPFVGVSSDFGTKYFAAGLAWYFPFGGQATWSGNGDVPSNDPLFVGARDGVQRWFAIDGSIRSMYITGAVAFRVPAWRLYVGASGSVIRNSVDTIRARNADGTDDIVSTFDNPTLKEGRSRLVADSWTGGFGLGVIWKPVESAEHQVWVGASYTSRPGISGSLKLDGTLTNLFVTSQRPEDTAVEFIEDLPDVYRIGARYRFRQLWEVRVSADYTRWSVVQRQCVLDKSVAGRTCDFANASSALDAPETYGQEGGVGVVQAFPRFWKDSFGIRAAASWWVRPAWELYGGLGYDSNAIPPETIDPTFMDSDKLIGHVGVRWQAARWVGINLSYTHVYYFPLSTDGRGVDHRFAGPSHQPNNNGTYRQQVGLFDVYADFQF